MRTTFPVAIVIAAACLGSCARPDASGSEKAGEYANLGPNATYVGKEVCGTCHPTQYNTYVESEMGRSFKPASLSKSDANFDQPAPIYDAHRDLYYQPFHVGEDLFVKEYRLAGRDTVYARTEKIDYIVGSGQHTNSHIMDVNGYLYQMPLTWYAQDGKWDLPPKYEDGNNARFDRPIPLECMTCHNGTPEFVTGSENRYVRVPEGIDCERCHGPGSVHVREKHAGIIVDTKVATDYSIVNPRKLPIDRQFDVCQRCHAQGATVFEDGKTSLDYRPGMRLADVANVFWPRFSDTVQRFTMASHPDRLKMSDCFRVSQIENEVEPLTCITCHDPHVSIKTLGADHYNGVCASCHAGTSQPRKAECSETEVVRAAAGDNCVGCHMPGSGSEDIPHIRITDHYIRSVDDLEGAPLSSEEIPSTREFLGMASLIDDSPTDKDFADGYLTYYEQITNHPGFLDSAAVHLARARSNGEETTESSIRLRFLQRDFENVVRQTRSMRAEQIDDAWTAYRVGDAHLSTGRARESVSFLERAVELAPFHLRFLNKLAVAYQKDGQPHGALEVYDRVVAANPKFHEAYNNRGFTRITVGDASGAESDFLTALSLEPDEEQTIANLASLYYNTGRIDEARPFGRRLLTMDPSNSQYRQLWALLN